MRRILAGTFLLGATAWGATATEQWASWRAGGSARLPLDASERAALLACQDPGELGLARVFVQDIRIDCPLHTQLPWWKAELGDALTAHAEPRSPRQEVRRALTAWTSGNRTALSTALEHPALGEGDRDQLLSFLALEDALPALHPRSAERIAHARLVEEHWVPDAALAARALRADRVVDGPRLAAALEIEWNQPLPCSDHCVDTVLSALESRAVHPLVPGARPLSARSPVTAAEDALERRQELHSWLAEDPARAERTDPFSAVIETEDPLLRAWIAADLAEGSGLDHRMTRSAAGVSLDWPGGTLHFAACPGEGATTATELEAALLSAPAQPRDDESAADHAGRLLRSLAQPTANPCAD